MNKIVTIISIGVVSLIASLTISNFTFAATSNSPRNDSEASTKTWCDTFGAGCGAAGGAMWVNNTSSNIYANNVNISTTGNSVSATIYGSIYTSIHYYNIGRTVYATNITDAKASGSLPFSTNGANWLSRGATQAPGWFSSAGQGTQISINVSSVPADGKTYNKFISVRRCWGYSPTGIDGACTTENTPVRITRSNPVNWTSFRKSYISTNKATVNGTNGESNPLTVTAGQTLYFRHRSDTSGTGVNYSLNVNGKGARLASFNNPLIWQNSTVNNVTGFYQISPYSGDNGSFTSYTTNKDDIGKTICQRMWVSKTAHNAGSGYSNWVCAKVVAEPWQLSLKTEIKGSFSGNNIYQNKNITAQVGETLNWKHTATNTTNYVAPADGTNKHGFGTLGYNLLYARTASPTNGVASPESHWVRHTANTPNINKNGGSYSYEASNSAYHGLSGITGIYSRNNNGNPPTNYTIKSDDAGKNFCQRQYTGRIKDGGSETWSDWRCAYVAYDYEIKPCMVTPTTPCGGVDIPSTPSETPTPPVPTIEVPSTTKDTQWVISEWTVPSEKEANPTATNWIDPESNYKHYYRSDSCDAYDAAYGVSRAESKCDNKTYKGNQIFTGTTTFANLVKNFALPEDAKLGQRYCIALSVSPYKMTAGQTEDQQNTNKDWRHGAPYCLIAMKEPKMQVWGGNTYAEKGIQTSSPFKYKENSFGSWVEYAGLSGSNIVGFGSASGPTTGRALNKALTFSNNTATLGHYGNVPVNDVAGRLQARYTTNVTNGCKESADPRFIVCKSISSTIDVNTLVSSQIATGKTVIIDGQDKTLNITADISTKNNPSSLSDIQQVILIGKNINIAPNVTKIDAWLLADESVVTCAEPENGTLVRNKAFVLPKNCDTPLKINGPIKAKALYSYRTAGGLREESGTPAEIYNFRADTYLWAKANSTNAGAYRTTYTKELSPRF